MGSGPPKRGQHEGASPCAQRPWVVLSVLAELKLKALEDLQGLRQKEM